MMMIEEEFQAGSSTCQQNTKMKCNMHKQKLIVVATEAQLVEIIYINLIQQLAERTMVLHVCLLVFLRPNTRLSG